MGEATIRLQHEEVGVATAAVRLVAATVEIVRPFWMFNIVMPSKMRGLAQAFDNTAAELEQLTARIQKVTDRAHAVALAIPDADWTSASESDRDQFRRDGVAMLMEIETADDVSGVLEGRKVVLEATRIRWSSAAMRKGAERLLRAIDAFSEAVARNEVVMREYAQRLADASHEDQLSDDSRAALQRGLDDVRAGRVARLPSFAQYLDES